MTLYLKYRPTTFEEVIGNDITIKSLQSITQKKEGVHTYLFGGSTGCGKTTLARITAEALGCVGNDIREVNFSDMRGIDTVRDIIKQSQFKPLEGKNRAWIIDECHRMTGDAQNAFLKILEDTPSHVYFILCTTEPNKLLSTIRGRCIQFNVQPLSEKDCYKLLRRVVVAEKEELTKEVYDQIIQDSLCHPRNALQILEQVLSVEPDQRLEVAKQKAAEYNEIIELARLLINDKTQWKQIAAVLKGLKEQDAEGIRRVVLGYAQAILLGGQANDRCGLVLECFKEPTYNSGFPQITLSCYSVIRN